MFSTAMSEGGEDGELFVRLRNFGCRLIGMKSYAVCFHLFHKRRSFTEEDEREYREFLKTKNYDWCENGLIKGPRPSGGESYA